MRLRGFVAMGAGVAGATLAHALDQAGLLPGVREAANVRGGMGGSVTVLWLGLAAALSWLAGRFGPVRVGAPASLLIAAIPELVGRHDLGAVAEPGAIAGAMLQWLLLVVVVVAAVVASRSALTVLAPSYGAISWPASVGSRLLARSRVVGRRGRPRAPPELPLLVHVVREEGHEPTSARAVHRARIAQCAPADPGRLWRLREGQGRRRERCCS